MGIQFASAALFLVMAMGMMAMVMRRFSRQAALAEGKVI
jgi:hypothetical protein